MDEIIHLNEYRCNLIRGYFMKIDGEVTTGLGKAAYFLSQEFYTREFKKNLGFIPYPGTLNVVVSEEFLDEISEIKNNCENLIKPDEGFGAVKYIEARLNDMKEFDNAPLTGCLTQTGRTLYDKWGIPSSRHTWRASSTSRVEQHVCSSSMKASSLSKSFIVTPSTS